MKPEEPQDQQLPEGPDNVGKHQETLMPAANGHGDPAQDQEVKASLAADPDRVGKADPADPAESSAEAEALAKADSRIAELERALDDARRDVELFKQDQAKVQQSLTEQLVNARSRADEALAEAANRYKTLALASSPEIPAELVQGQTVEEVEASMAQARVIVQKVRDQLAARAPDVPPVGGGAPVRQEPDTSQLSPLDKIRYAISRRK